MSHRQEVMSLIMSGFDSSIELKTSDGSRTMIVNTFIYQGDYFEAFADFGVIKSIQRIPLLNIKEVRSSANGHEIEYNDESIIYLSKKKA